MPALEDVFAEIRAVEAWQDRVRRAEAGANLFSERQVEEMRLAASMYPHLSPGALLALGKGGYRADHPLVQQIGELSSRLFLRDHPYGAEFGDRTVTPAMRRARSEAQREQNRARTMFESDLPPAWVGNDPDNLALWRQAVDAGITVGTAVTVGEDMNINSPEFYAWRDILNRFSDKGVQVPLVDKRGLRLFLTSPQEPDPKFGEGTFQEGLRFGWEQVEGLRPGTDEWRQATGQRPRAGPGFMDTFREVTGTPQASTPAEIQAAGVADLSLTAPVRGAFMAADAPVQELQGQVRNLYAIQSGRLTDPGMLVEPQSDLGIMLTTGRSAGTGFFVDQESEVARERRRREERRGQIGGHNITLGRWVADGLLPTDIDSRPAMILSGLVDFGVQVYADPTAFAAGRLGRLQESRRLFAATDAEEAAGVVRGLRWMVRPQSPQHWMNSERGIGAMERLATERSPYTIWRNSNRKLPIEVARDIADARSVDEVRRVLEPELGGRIREVAAVQSSRGGTLNVMPARGKIDAHDPDIVAWEVEASLRNAHATDDQIRVAVDRVARAKDEIELNAAIRRAVDDDLDGLLVRGGVKDERIRSTVLRLHQTSHEEASNTFVEAVTYNGPTDNPLLLSGETVHYPGAHLFVEHAPRWISMPDARTIRTLTSRYSNILGHNVFVNADGTNRLPTAAAHFLMNDVWKPLQLMRMAWTVRVIAEEQVRMAAAGYDSMFKHPLSYMAWRTGRRGRGKADSWLHPFALAADAKGRRGQTDVQGLLLEEADEFKAAMAQSHGGWVDRAMPQTGIRTTFYKGRVHERDRYNEAWATELIRLSSDPVAREVSRAESLDDAVEWFTRGSGNRFRGGLASAHPGRFDTPDAARAYIETVQRRIDNATGGNPDLLSAVRTGRFADGESMLTGTGQHENLSGWLDGFHDDFAPQAMLGTERLPTGGLGHWNRVVDNMFGFLMTRRTNSLSRSPTFKQEYWKETERLIGFTDETTKARIIEAAREAGLSNRAIRRMERARPTGQATLDEIDLWAKGHALDRTKDLLYDMTRRGRFMDASRIVFPFGEAWSEVLQEWFHPTRGLASPLTGRGLRNLRRFQQTVQGARGEGFGELMGAPEGEDGSLGFFWKNEFGEEVFVYPGSSFLTEHLVGVPIPMTGRVQGLSMFGTVMPGLGPAVQIPVGWFLQNKPGPQWMKEAVAQLEGIELGPLGTVREQLIPFGSPGATDQGDIASVLNFVPPWMRTTFDWISAGDGNERAWMNSVMAVAGYLRTTGGYGDSVEEQQRLMADAERKARWFHLIKAVGASVLPASPAAEWQVLDRNDKLLRLRALAEEYRDLQAEDYATADQVFLDRYGVDVLAAVQPRSAGIEYAVPVTRDGANWVLSNPGVKGDLPHTYGFFAPQGGEFDYSLYDAQFENNERVLLDPETHIRLMNATKANLILEDTRNQIGDDVPDDIADRFLADTRAWLNDEYPGWNDSTGLPDRPSTATMIRELYDALNNPAVMDTDAGQGLRLYLEGRDEVVELMQSRGLRGRDGVLSTSQRMADARAYLKDLAAWVIDRHPDFKLVFDIVLSREVTVDE